VHREQVRRWYVEMISCKKNYGLWLLVLEVAEDEHDVIDHEQDHEQPEQVDHCPPRTLNVEVEH